MRIGDQIVIPASTSFRVFLSGLSSGFWYQLKSQKIRIASTVTDGAYGAMMDAIRNYCSPNFFFLHYDLATWTVRNLLLVPHFAFPPSAIIKRKPLSPTARRAGWVGCNFDLKRIPAEARIPVVTNSEISPAHEVREKFKRVNPLKEISVKERGWTLEVLTLVRRLVDRRRRGNETQTEKSGPSQRLLTSSPTAEFTNGDAYTLADQLAQLHPDNRHIRDKIRQQLQVLRDAGLLIHVERGVWRLP